MFKKLKAKILDIYNIAFTGTKINSKHSEDEIERHTAYAYEERVNNAKVCLDLVKAVNEKLENRIKDLEEVRDAAEKANVEFRYISELEFLKELRG